MSSAPQNRNIRFWGWLPGSRGRLDGSERGRARTDPQADATGLAPESSRSEPPGNTGGSLLFLPGGHGTASGETPEQRLEGRKRDDAGPQGPAFLMDAAAVRWLSEPSFDVRPSLSGLVELRGLPEGRSVRAHDPVYPEFSRQGALVRPLSASELVVRGKAYMQRQDLQGDIGKALADFEAAVGQDPQNATALAGLTMARLAKMGESLDPALLRLAGQSADLR